MAKKSRYKADWFASLNDSDNYGTIFIGMIKSKRFQALTPRAQTLYVVCRVHAQNVTAKQALYKFCKEHEIKAIFESYFVLTTKQAAEYGYNSPNKSRYLKELESNGFIKTVISGYKKRQANLYSFDDKWKTKQSITGDIFGADKAQQQVSM